MKQSNQDLEIFLKDQTSTVKKLQGRSGLGATADQVKMIRGKNKTQELHVDMDQNNDLSGDAQNKETF